MNNRNFIFKVPPPPPPTTKYPPKPPLPPPSAAPPLAQPPPPPPPVSTQNWSNWSFDFSRPPPPVFSAPSCSNGMNMSTPAYGGQQNSVPVPNLSPGSNTAQYYGIKPENHNFYGSGMNRQYNQRRYSNNSQTWNRPSNFKRPRYDNRMDQEGDRSYYRNYESRFNRNFGGSGHSYSNSSNDSSSSAEFKHQEETPRGRKRKKPLSQGAPAKKTWTDEEAQMVLELEKEYHHIFKNHSLRITFPDQELNRDIVSKFHDSIETVYFQQPSNPRFCFVTLKDVADPNQVIEELNKIKFGLGYLSAECKKDKDEQSLSSDDLDPYTLYVGNLAQEVTKEDIVTLYPKHKRIDIGFAKKMRYTRYAFVSFRNVQDSMEAFRATHYADLYSKNMIVRFRRLNGTIGMPGEPKIQHAPKVEAPKKKEIANEPSQAASLPDEDEVSVVSSTDSTMRLDTSIVKSEPYDDDGELSDRSDEGSYEHHESDEWSGITETIVKKEPPEFSTPFLPEMPQLPLPMPAPLKDERLSPRSDDGECDSPSKLDDELCNGLIEPKKEEEIDEPADPDDNEDEFNTTTDFGFVLSNFTRHQMNSLKRV